MTGVRATLTGTWPGTDVHQAATAIVHELAAPQVPVLPVLPARGPGTDPVGRTAVMLEELTVDLQPHGWRLTDTPGVDARRGSAAWRSDLNRLADVVGKSGATLEELSLTIVGPMSMATRLWLPGGERALSDSGARRDVADALAAGVADQLATVRSVTGAERLTVVIEEPDLGRVMTGQVPTASGYRTVRSIPRHEVRRAWSVLAEALSSSGIVFAPSPGSGEAAPRWSDLAVLASESLPARTSEQMHDDGTPDDGEPAALEATPMRGLVLPVPRLEGPGADPERWEVIAGWAEAGRTLMLGLDLTSSGKTPAPVRTGVDSVLRSLVQDWRRFGLGSGLLGQVVLRGPGLESNTPRRALETTRELVRGAEQLERLRVDGTLED